MIKIFNTIKWVPVLVKASVVIAAVIGFRIWLSTVKQAEYDRGFNARNVTCLKEIQEMDSARQKHKDKVIRDWNIIDSGPTLAPADLLDRMRQNRL